MTTYWLTGEKESPESINLKDNKQKQTDITVETYNLERRDSKTISWSSSIPDTKSSKLNVINEHKGSLKYPKTAHPTKLKSTNNSKSNYKNNITSQF